jgi:hypothetical protein
MLFAEHGVFHRSAPFYIGTQIYADQRRKGKDPWHVIVMAKAK